MYGMRVSEDPIYIFKWKLVVTDLEHIRKNIRWITLKQPNQIRKTEFTNPCWWLIVVIVTSCKLSCKYTSPHASLLYKFPKSGPIHPTY